MPIKFIVYITDITHYSKVLGMLLKGRIGQVASNSIAVDIHSLDVT